MIEAIKIENYKSIEELELELGRVNVLIGENGAGKSNLLEAITLLGAAIDSKLDNEFLFSRGVRVVDPILMRSMFDKEYLSEEIQFSFFAPDYYSDASQKTHISLSHDNKPYSRWKSDMVPLYTPSPETISQIQEKPKRRIFTSPEPAIDLPVAVFLYLDDIFSGHHGIKQAPIKASDVRSLANFLIYSPENLALRTLEREGQIQPLGINGEGLLKLLKVLHRKQQFNKIDEIKNILRMLCWFEDFEPEIDLRENRLEIRDKFLDIDFRTFDQRSANEGFLFILFYAALMVADETPKFFAIDNVDASLNPKLCTELVRQIVRLAKKYDKQVILTTHNPAILDGLNLDDDEQRLFVVSRNKSGRTRVRRIHKPRPIGDESPVKLSRAFLSGMLGGLPKGFS